MPRGYEIDRDDDGLTARERQVLEALESGATQAEIAQREGLTKQRVSAIVKALRSKNRLHG